MDFKISDAHDLLSKAMDARSIRQKLISGNIANVDTPFYKSKDIDFETALSLEASKIFNTNHPKELPLAKTHINHLNTINDIEDAKSTIYFRDGHTVRNDANSVDLDIETTEMSKNTIMFNALSAAIKKDSLLFRSVIEASGKVQ